MPRPHTEASWVYSNQIMYKLYGCNADFLYVIAYPSKIISYNSSLTVLNAFYITNKSNVPMVYGFLSQCQVPKEWESQCYFAVVSVNKSEKLVSFPQQICEISLEINRCQSIPETDIIDPPQNITTLTVFPKTIDPILFWIYPAIYTSLGLLTIILFITLGFPSLREWRLNIKIKKRVLKEEARISYLDTYKITDNSLPLKIADITLQKEILNIPINPKEIEHAIQDIQFLKKKEASRLAKQILDSNLIDNSKELLIAYVKDLETKRNQIALHAFLLTMKDIYDQRIK